MGDNGKRESTMDGRIDRWGSGRAAAAWGVSLLSATALLSTPLAGQQCAGGLPPFGSIGVGQFECVGGSCAVNMRNGDSYSHAFSAEPRLLRIDPAGPGAGYLQERDVLVAVNGKLITTMAGGRELGSLQPGRLARLTLRRDGRETDVLFTPVASCAFPGLVVTSGDRTAWSYGSGATVLQRGSASGDSTWIGLGDSTVIVSGEAARVAYEWSPADSVPWRTLTFRGGPMTVTWDSAGRTVGVARSLRDELDMRTRILAGNARLDSLGRAGRLRPPAELGVQLTCGDCGFRLREGNVVFETEVFPVVDAVERGGPADRGGVRVGDVLLTIGGRAITSDRTLAELRVGRPVPVEVRRGDRVVRLTVTPRGPGERSQRW